jgi:hypothetical protein
LVHERIVAFAKRRAGLEWEEARLLCEAQRAGVHRRLGFASFGEYVERHFGYNRRLVKEKLRVALAIERLPRTSEALRSGEVNWSAVRELTRVAAPETEGAWLEAARGRTARQVEEMVSGRALGDLPTTPADPKLRTYHIHLELCAETRAVFVEALAALRKHAGEALDDDAAVLLMSQRVLDTLGRAGVCADSGVSVDADSSVGEGTDVGANSGVGASSGVGANSGRDSARAGYQVQVNICKKCRYAEQIGNGQAHPIAPAIAEMVMCDAQVIDASDRTQVGPRATQTIPPAIRRQVLLRDNGRCIVRGCRNTIALHVHHLTPRSDGGRHDPENLGCLCGAHHRGTHEGRLIIEGRPSTGLVFKHADGTPYGGAVEAGAADRNAQVFAALRTMGFKERDCRTAVERCAIASPVATREELLRAALGLLTC